MNVLIAVSIIYNDMLVAAKEHKNIKIVLLSTLFFFFLDPKMWCVDWTMVHQFNQHLLADLRLTVIQIPDQAVDKRVIC